MTLTSQSRRLCREKCRARHLHIISDYVFLQALRDRRRQPRLKVQQQLLLQTINVQIALDPAFRGSQRRVIALPRSQPVYVVGSLAVQEARAVGPGQANPAAETQIQDSNVLAEGSRSEE